MPQTIRDRMRSEQECKPKERYLFTDELFSDESITIWQGECISRVKSRNMDKGECYDKFISWKRKDNEVALFTLYAYADFKIPKQFDCIFDLDNPARFELTDMVLTQSIYEGWYPIDSIEDGHKHLCIFEFKNKVSELVRGLHVATGKFSKIPKSTLRLGICQSEDFEEIKTRIEYILGLKKIYEHDWWKYDEEQ
jgi:hypothetical protein